MITYCTRGWCNDCKSEALLEVNEDGVQTCTACGKTKHVCAKCYGTGWYQESIRDEGGQLLFHISEPCPDCNKKKGGAE